MYYIGKALLHIKKQVKLEQQKVMSEGAIQYTFSFCYIVFNVFAYVTEM